MKFKLVCVVLIISSLMVSCAAPVTRNAQIDNRAMRIEEQKQMDIALLSLIKNERRLDSVAYSLFAGAASMCENKTRFVSGIQVANIYLFHKDMRPAAKRLYGMDDHPGVLYVSRNSPAEKAGLQIGDLILSVNGKPVSTGETAVTDFDAIFNEVSRHSNNVKIRVRRKGKNLTFVLQPEKACDYGYGVVNHDMVNAFADGRNVFVTIGMMRFVDDDNELALVVSHELAHNVMDHVSKKRRNSMLGSIFDVIAGGYGVDTGGLFGNIGANVYSKEFEAEADYIGLYLMARSGEKIEQAPYFWRRMAAANPGSIKTNHSASHPATPQRFLALEQTVYEVERKRKLGQPLKPEMKKNH